MPLRRRLPRATSATAAIAKDAPELNRTKGALTGSAWGVAKAASAVRPAAEILAAARSVPLAEVGRLRGQPPIKPLSMATVLLSVATAKGRDV